MSNQQSSISDNGYYPLIVKEATINEKTFDIFKRHPWYTPILEHVNYEDGVKYLEIITKEYEFLLPNIEKYKTNDSVGSPIKYTYQNIGEVSPTTLRYIKVLGDIITNLNDLNDSDIVEIGCGYGGQSKIILDTYNVKSYTFIDLPEVLDLTKKYLSRFGVDMSKLIFKDINSITENEKYDLFISNYAYTECEENIREIYFNKILSKSKMGYLTSNFLSKETMDNEVINRIKNATTIEERPYTGDKNFIIIWK
jgi:putative sugar O-methyltransferase